MKIIKVALLYIMLEVIILAKLKLYSNKKKTTSKASIKENGGDINQSLVVYASPSSNPSDKNQCLHCISVCGSLDNISSCSSLNGSSSCSCKSQKTGNFTLPNSNNGGSFSTEPIQGINQSQNSPNLNFQIQPGNNDHQHGQSSNYFHNHPNGYDYKYSYNTGNTPTSYSYGLNSGSNLGYSYGLNSGSNLGYSYGLNSGSTLGYSYGGSSSSSGSSSRSSSSSGSSSGSSSSPGYIRPAGESTTVSTDGNGKINSIVKVAKK